MKNNSQQFKPKYLLYGFTTYAFVQFIGYLGSAYNFLLQPALIIVLLICIVALSLGFLEWSNKQNRINGRLANAQIFSSFTPSLIIITLLISVIAVGAWIAS